MAANEMTIQTAVKVSIQFRNTEVIVQPLNSNTFRLLTSTYKGTNHEERKVTMFFVSTEPFWANSKLCSFLSHRTNNIRAKR